MRVSEGGARPNEAPKATPATRFGEAMRRARDRVPPDPPGAAREVGRAALARRTSAEGKGAALAGRRVRSREHEAAELGTWAFLVTEVLLFGGLFGTYAVYRHMHPEAFAHASDALDVKLGAINTGVLIGSSLTMVLAVEAGRRRAGRAIA